MIEDVEQKVKDQAYFESALMVANLTEENANLKQKIKWAIECIDADGRTKTATGGMCRS